MDNLELGWEFNVAGVENYRKPGRLSRYFEFVRLNHDQIDGDILEAGVYRGGSLIAMGLLLRELGSSKKVYGFDTFQGFPPEKVAQDQLAQFAKLNSLGKISEAHFQATLRNARLREAVLGFEAGVDTISSSGRFDMTSLDLLKRKIRFFDLDNVVLVEGQFSDTMRASHEEPSKIMATLIDCDLYKGYVSTLAFCWPRLEEGGMVFLDEYFSLKFPGARTAVDEFVATNPEGAHLVRDDRQDGDGFERWWLRKF